VLLRFLSPKHRRRNPNSISWFSPYECLRKNMIFKVSLIFFPSLDYNVRI
jgi:hypothetical protein